MKCSKCGNEISAELFETFGDLAMCPPCNGIVISAREASNQIREIIANLYTINGNEGMQAISQDIVTIMKEFGII